VSPFRAPPTLAKPGAAVLFQYRPPLKNAEGNPVIAGDRIPDAQKIARA